MNDELLALSAWREQALSRGIAKDTVPSAFELGIFLRAKNDPATWQAKPALAMWGDSLTKLLQAVATGNYVQGTPLPDLFFTPAGGAAAPKPAPAREPVHEPQPEPEPEPVPKPEREVRRDEVRGFTGASASESPKPALNLRAEDFAERNVFKHPVPLQLAGGELHVRAKGDEEGSLEVSWVAPDADGAAVRIFRLLSRDTLIREDEIEPDTGRLRTITTGRLWVDTELMTRAIRSYHVWVNEGETEAEALRAEPKFVGLGVYVRPVDDLHVTFEDGRIYGSFAEVDGTSRVEIALLDELHERIDQFPDQDNLRGFQMEPTNTGRSYIFQARRFVGQHASAYSDEQAVDVPAELTRITPEITRQGERFALNWQRPGAGEVRIYRSADPVADGAAGQLVDADNLGEYGLQVGDWMNRLESKDATEFALDWKGDAYSMYITAVNVVENQAMIGDTQSWVRCGTATDVRIFERVDEQLITFTWPEHAAGVEFFNADLGSKDRLDFGSPEAFQVDPSVQQLGRISENQYRRRGGYRVNLQTTSCLILMPYRSHQGRTVYGEPTLVDYPGLVKMRYELLSDATATSPPTQFWVRIHAQDKHDGVGQRFVLLAKEGMLPIDPTQDDMQLEVWRQPVQDRGQTSERLYPEKIFESRDPAARDRISGAELPGETFAVNMEPLRHRRNMFLRLFLYTPFGGYERVYGQDTAHGEYLEPVPVLLDPPLGSLYYPGEQPVQPPLPPGPHPGPHPGPDPEPQPDEREQGGGRFNLFRRKR